MPYFSNLQIVVYSCLPLCIDGIGETQTDKEWRSEVQKVFIMAIVIPLGVIFPIAFVFVLDQFIAIFEIYFTFSSLALKINQMLGNIWPYCYIDSWARGWF